MGDVLSIRVRYSECDPMGVAHHAVYPVWFEMGRTEALRGTGVAYRDLEGRGDFLVVVDLQVRYRRPARYDDHLDLETTVAECGHVKIVHEYALRRGDELLATARTLLACVGPDGRPRALPPEVRGD